LLELKTRPDHDDNVSTTKICLQ